MTGPSPTDHAVLSIIPAGRCRTVTQLNHPACCRTHLTIAIIDKRVLHPDPPWHTLAILPKASNLAPDLNQRRLHPRHPHRFQRVIHRVAFADSIDVQPHPAPDKTHRRLSALPQHHSLITHLVLGLGQLGSAGPTTVFPCPFPHRQQRPHRNIKRPPHSYDHTRPPARATQTSQPTRPPARPPPAD